MDYSILWPTRGATCCPYEVASRIFVLRVYVYPLVRSFSQMCTASKLSLNLRGDAAFSWSDCFAWSSWFGSQRDWSRRQNTTWGGDIYEYRRSSRAARLRVKKPRLAAQGSSNIVFNFFTSSLLCTLDNLLHPFSLHIHISVPLERHLPQ
jgi:hypothetical protein